MIRRLDAEQTIQLCELLIRKTASGEIVWATSDENWMEASLNSYVYTISALDLDGVHPFRLGVWDSSGSEEIMGAASQPDLDQAVLDLFAKLFQVARASATTAGDLFANVVFDITRNDEPF